MSASAKAKDVWGCEKCNFKSTDLKKVEAHEAHCQGSGIGAGRPNPRTEPAKIIQWLDKFEKDIQPANKVELKKQSTDVFKWLLAVASAGPGIPIQRRVSACTAALFNIAGTKDLSVVVNRCVELVKAKEDGLQRNRICAMAVIASIVGTLGGAIAPFVPDIVKEFARGMKANEVDHRLASLRALTALIPVSQNRQLADIYKCIKLGCTDKALDVRVSAAECASAMIVNANYLQTNELNDVINSGFKALEDASYPVRRAVAAMLGSLLTSALDSKTWAGVKKPSKPSSDDVLQILATGFIKADPGRNEHGKSIRVGIAQVYVTFLKRLGANWLEKHVNPVIKHLRQVLGQTTSTKTSMEDGTLTRKCILHIILNVHGHTLGEKGRSDTVLAVCNFINDTLAAPSRDPRDMTHTLVCGLNAIAELVDIIGSPIVGSCDTIMKTVFAAGTTSVPAVRFAAAESLRSLGNVLPSRASFLANQCLDRIKKFRRTPDAVHGASYLLAAVVGGSASSSLGLPHELSANILDLGQQLSCMRPVKKDEVATITADVVAGWALVGSLTSLGSAAVLPHVKQLTNLWAASFPREDPASPAVKKRDINTWAVMLHIRIGALTSITGFLLDCSQLVTIEYSKMIAGWLGNELRVLEYVPNAKAGAAIKDLVTTLRLRLYSVFALIPVHIYEESIPKLLPHLVADFTLVEGPQNVHPFTSLLRSMCHDGDGILLGPGNHETDEQDIEDFLLEHGGGGLRSVENDPHVLFYPAERYQTSLPASIAVIDAAVKLFGVVFPCIGSQKHRHQLLEHFTSCIKTTRVGTRRQAIQVNIFTAFIAALKQTVVRKANLGSEKVIATARALVLDALTNTDVTLRCAAGEALGRMGQVVGGSFVSDIISFSIDHIQKDGKIVPRTGLSLGLGCVHRYVGGMAADGRLIKNSVEILQALAKDTTAIVSTWALHSIMLTVDAAGHNLGGSINPMLALIQELVMSTPPSRTTVLECCGKLLNTIISAIGPELQADASRRRRILVLCTELQRSSSGPVRLTGLNGIQQMIIFAPKQVDITTFIPQLQTTLSSPNLQLRLAAAACLRQLSQREPELVFRNASGIEQKLFRMLDSESDARLQFDIREAITGMLIALAEKQPKFWLVLCNKVLSGATENETKAAVNASHAEEDDGGDEGGSVRMSEEIRTVLPTKWQTKVFAVSCVRKVIQMCAIVKQSVTVDNPHFHMSEATKSGAAGDVLVVQLSELVRTTYLAATSTINELRQVGLEALQDIIAHFSGSLDLEMGGNHTLLEQYQAQVTSALRPAFDSMTPPDVTCIAAHTVAAWIGSGVQRNVSDLRRVLSLLEDRLEAIRSAPDPAYNERATTVLRLAILSSWGHMAIKAADQPSEEYLSKIVTPHRDRLVSHWSAALNDYAFISLPAEYADQIPLEGNFYYAGTKAAVLPAYEQSFPVLIRAASMYMDTSDSAPQRDYYLILGLCSRVLCGPVVDDEVAIACLAALENVLPKSRRLADDSNLFFELITILQRVIRDYKQSVRIAAVRVVLRCLEAKDVFGAGQLTNMTPGESPIYTLLETCIQAILTVIPMLKKDDGREGLEALHEMSESNQELVSYCIQALALIPEFCEPVDRVLMLPTLIRPVLSILTNPESSLCSTALQALRKVLQCIPTDVPSVVSQADAHVYSCAKDVLEALLLGETCANPKSLLLGLAVIHLSAPIIMNSDDIQQDSVTALKTFMQEEFAPDVRKTALQVTSSLLRLPGAPISHYVPELGSLAFAFLKSARTHPPKSEEELLMVKEAVALVVALVALASPESRVGALALASKHLVDLLTGGSSFQRQLHNEALDQMKKIGPLYPQEFKTVMAAAPALAQSLGAAIKEGASRQSAGSGATRSAPVLAPQIKLKMDFSAFG